MANNTEEINSELETQSDIVVDTFIKQTPAYYSSDEDSDVQENGEMKAAYSLDDMMEELAKNGGTLTRPVTYDVEDTGETEQLYENIRFGTTGDVDLEEEDEDYGWGSSEFEDYDDDCEPANAGDNGPVSVDTFFKSSKNFENGSGQGSGSHENLEVQEERGKSRFKKIAPFFGELRKKAFRRTPDTAPTSMFDRFQRFGPKKPLKPVEKVVDDLNNDLEPLNFGVGNKEFKPACLSILLPEVTTVVQKKRRQIVEAIIESEKSYLFSLKRLIEEYQLPLLQKQPLILGQKYVRVIFFKIRDILQCHLLFHGELYDVAERWDEEEKIGDVFVASFSKSTVFDAYSSFVNNFPTAMEAAKKQARIKSAFNAFLKDKLDTSKDKLSLFGLMVKPIQRFPQYIMLLQDLLKNTPKEHADRLSLQLALTELEMLTDRLNETKRSCESRMEAKKLSEVLQFGRAMTRPDADSLFIRQDDVVQHKTKDGETLSKRRRLFLLSDQLICSTVSKQKELVDSGVSLLSPASEKLEVSWIAPVKDVEVVDPTLPSYRGQPLSRPSFSQNSSQLRKSTEKQQKYHLRSSSPAAPKTNNPYWKELDNMLHDLKTFEMMLELYSQLILKYEALPVDSLKGPIKNLEILIRQKVDVDKNIVNLSIPTRHFHLMEGVSGFAGMSTSLTEQIIRRGKKLVTLEFPSLTMKHDWLIELQSAKLATDPTNFPAWYLSENDPLSARNPRFMTALKMEVITKEDKKMTLKLKKKTNNELTCCTYVTLPCHSKPGTGISHLWACVGGRAAVVSLHTNQPFVIEYFNVCDGCIVATECVPDRETLFESPRVETENSNVGDDLISCGSAGCDNTETVWMISDDSKIYRFPSIQNERRQLGKPVRLNSGKIRCMKYLNDRVYLGTHDGVLLIYSRCNKDGFWNFTSPQKLCIGKEVVSCFLVVDDDNLWVSCASKIYVLEVQGCLESSRVYVKTSHSLLSDNTFSSPDSTMTGSSPSSPSSPPNAFSIECMVKAGVGLLVSFRDQSTIRLYHIESFRYLQDISISSAVTKLLEEKGSTMKPDQSLSSLSITCMLPDRGVLYVGTNMGFVLTLPLPRLNGMPQFRQRPAISYQGHTGPVKFLASIHCSLVEQGINLSDTASNQPAPAETPPRAAIVNSGSISTETLTAEDPALLASSLRTPVRSEISGSQTTGTLDGIGGSIKGFVTHASTSSSTPDLLNSFDSENKNHQVDGLYESLLRGLRENGNDAVVLEQIARTPLPQRRKKNFQLITRRGQERSSFGRTTGQDLTASLKTFDLPAKNRNVSKRHSSFEFSSHQPTNYQASNLCGGESQAELVAVLESSEANETKPARDDVGVSTDENQINVVRTTATESPSCLNNESSSCNVPDTISSIEPSATEETPDNNNDKPNQDVTSLATTPRILTQASNQDVTLLATTPSISTQASNLSKSASSASDTPSQKSFSSSASSITRRISISTIPEKKISTTFSRVGVPSSSAMISSNLTTTPKSRAIVFASAGLGHVAWNCPQKPESSSDKPFLLLWMC